MHKTYNKTSRTWFYKLSLPEVIQRVPRLLKMLFSYSSPPWVSLPFLGPLHFSFLALDPLPFYFNLNLSCLDFFLPFPFSLPPDTSCWCHWVQFNSLKKKSVFEPWFSPLIISKQRACLPFSFTSLNILTKCVFLIWLHELRHTCNPDRLLWT